MGWEVNAAPATRPRAASKTILRFRADRRRRIESNSKRLVNWSAPAALLMA